MTSTSTRTAASTSDDRYRVRRSLPAVAAGVLVASVALTVYGAHDLTEIVVVTGIIVATMVGVYGFLVPRGLARESAGGTSVTLAVLGLLLILPAFWSGLPLVLGAAGAMLGWAGRTATTGAGKAQLGFALGMLATVGYFAAYLTDALK